MRFALVAEPETLEEDEFIGRETVMHLAGFDVLGRHASFLERNLRGALRHVEAHEIHRRAREQRRTVGHQRLAGHQHRVSLQFRLGVEEALGHDDCAARAVRGGRALQFRQGIVDHGRFLDLVEAVHCVELRVGVARGVFV